MSIPGAPIGSREPLDLAAAARKIPFQKPESAREHLACALKRVSKELAGAVPALLADAPDPDSAVLLFDRLVGHSAELVRLLEDHNFLAHYAIAVFGHSRYLGETLLRNTDLVHSFLREKNLDRSFSREEFREALARFRSRSFETDIALLLARFKRREYVRIMLRDVLTIAPLAETTAEISALSDVLIEGALREADSLLQRKYGMPQHVDKEGRLVDTPFAVLSLGKLGGHELNYSSDVDLFYLYGDGEEAPDAVISSREYFVRLSQQLTDILSRITPDGPVFRIDLRLRPQGNEGELAVSLAHALRYYAEVAHDWERQALIKVRYSAGNAALARQFIRGVQPHIYRERVNFAAVKTALVSREKMHARPRRSIQNQASDIIDVKLDRGGIRDIEFLVQCLQRVYGGAEEWLRSGGTLFSLQKLHDKGHISGKEFHDLNNAYVFLRHLEHRLQLRMGQQTHRLPAGTRDFEVLRRSMSGLMTGEDRSGDLLDAVRRRMTAVGEIYHRVIYQQHARGEQEAPGSDFRLNSPVELGLTDQPYQQMLDQLAQDAPALDEIARARHLSPPARRNLYRFLSSSFTSSERYAEVRRHPEAVSRALALLETSDYLTDILIRHPEEITTLASFDNQPAYRGSAYLFERPLVGGRVSSDFIFEYLATSAAPYGEKLSLLRRHYRHRIFASGARDISQLRDVYESLATTTAAAEDAIAAALAIAGQPLGMAVGAVGRLGSGEFDLLSDADMLFVCEDGLDRPGLTKTAEQLMQALAAYTQDGMVFPVDARLRPRGGEGELLISPKQLESYFLQEAQPWEALMYTKLRFIAGSRPVAEKAAGVVRVLFQRFAADPDFAANVRDMRARLEQADRGEKNLKTACGGAYDIDFIVSYLLVKHGSRETGGSLRDRLWRCSSQGHLARSEAAVLDHAAELLRTVEHVIRLVIGRSRKWLPVTEHARRVTEELTSRILHQEFPEGLEAELERTCREVRKIYDRVLA